MALDDPSLVEARWRASLLDDPEDLLFARLASCIDDFYRRRIPDAAVELLAAMRAFVPALRDDRFSRRLRDVYACEYEDEAVTRVTRACFTDYGPARASQNSPENQNAQRWISEPLGVQKMHARMHQRRRHEALLYTPWPEVVDILCHNSTILERDILAMASRRPTRSSLLEPILCSPWSTRPEIRFALASNPYLAVSHALRCALALPRENLSDLAVAPDVHDRVRAFARDLLDL